MKHMKIKRIVMLICSFSMVISLLTPTSVCAEEYTWDSFPPLYKYPYAQQGVDTDILCMPFRPEDLYVSHQNPLSFTWPYATDALGYDLVVYGDKELTDVKYKQDMLKWNVHTPNIPFETGVQYYWTVRYHMADGVSEWSEPRRFRIDPDAYAFEFEDMDTIMSRVPASHPRIFTRPEKLDELRSYKDTNNAARIVYDKYLDDATRYKNANSITAEPTPGGLGFDPDGTLTPEQEAEYMNYTNNAVDKMTVQIEACSLVYLLAGNTEAGKEIGTYGKKVLLALAGWDPNGATSATRATQANRAIAIVSARAYDWLYDLFTPEEKTKILTMIKARTDPISIYPEYERQYPYGSHPLTRFHYAGVIAYATYGEIEGYDQLLRDTIEVAISFFPPWSYEDGGWSEGTDYWTYSSSSSKEFYDVLALGGVINFYEKAWLQNEYLFPLYAYPTGTYGGFGHGSGTEAAEENLYVNELVRRMAYYTQNPVAKWFVDNCRGVDDYYGDAYSYVATLSSNIEAKAPIDYPLSHHFKDIGWVVMTNDLIDQDRIHLMFRSSPFGTFSHSMADQNSFLLTAFGEKLAIQSGYYDAYASTHMENFYGQTFTKNSVTHDGGQGQTYYSIDADGEIKQFVNQFSFDSVTGDATPAYFGDLDLYERNIIYLRPDVFVVVDDLDAKGDTSSSFEWWLNAENSITLSENSALIAQGDARLKASVKYPQNVTSTYYDGFKAPNGNTYKPGVLYTNAVGQKRVSFTTEEVPNTKFVVVMDVYKNGSTSAKNVNTEYFDTYLKMTFEDGTVVLVNTGNRNDSVIANDITFTGTAVAYNNYSIMLTNGSYLKVGSDVMIDANTALSAAIGCNEISISADKDCSIQLSSTNKYLSVDSIEDLKDSQGRAISSKIGVTATIENGKISMTAEKGDYVFLNNGYRFIGAAQYVPCNITTGENEDENAIVVSWDKAKGCVYDVDVNGKLYENVTAPFSFTIDDGVTDYKIVVTAKMYGQQKSAAVYHYTNFPDYYSHVKYSASSKSKNAVTAKIYVDAEKQKNVKLISALFDQNGALKDSVISSGNNGILSVDIPFSNLENETIKTFLLGDAGKPLIPCAEYQAAENALDISGIYLNGEMISDFNSETTEYTVSLQGYDVYPVVTVHPVNSASKAVVTTDCDNQITTVKITGQGGSSREIKIKYSNVSGVKGYISNLNMLVTTYDSLSDELKAGCTDTQTDKLNFATYRLLTGFSSGKQLFSDRAAYKIGYVDDMAELEGCYYIAPSYNQKGSYDVKASWQNAYYYGLGAFSMGGKRYQYPGMKEKINDLYRFDLNTSANLYVVTYGNKPAFLDDSWKKVNVDPAFILVISNTRYVYDDVYVKHIDVKDGESRTITMQTPATGDAEDGLYTLLIKPTN